MDEGLFYIPASVIQFYSLKAQRLLSLARVMKHIFFSIFTATYLLIMGVTAPAWAQYGRCVKYLNNKPLPLTPQLIQSTSELSSTLYFGNNTWAKEYIQLATTSKLINQSDPRLGEMGLLKEGGGLCGPTCLANAYISKDSLVSQTPSSYWTQNSPLLVKTILDKYFNYTLNIKELPYMDPREGTFIQYYMSEGSFMLKEMGLKARNLDIQSPTHMFYMLKSRDSLIAGSVKFLDSMELRDARHAILILGADSVTGQLVIADPNMAHNILVTPYTVNRGRIQFSLWSELYAGSKKVELDEGYLFTIEN